MKSSYRKRNPMNRRTARGVLVVAAAGLSVMVAASAADAHVRVSSEGAAVQGGDTVLVFSVPSEENANTVTLSVTIPADTAIASISTMPMAGWTVSTTEQKLASPLSTDDGQVTQAVSTITWTAAAGGGIPPGSFEEFKVSAGPMPKVATIAFPAVQTYSNGDVVRWIEPTPPNGSEPDHPAPVLDLVSGEATQPVPGQVSVDRSRTNSTDDTARTLGVAGVIVGALGLLTAGAAIGVRRRHP
jgi:uncharacterized protein YcnI